ncbi:hypothetical protein [Pararobbsia alpina]|uniref:hypothetical protein n=1 Tax=Pararobbsia alpina TaxID=621374 RepID=UPI0015815E96|nr:hypothetical protein [Pararobbsia alpina]
MAKFEFHARGFTMCACQLQILGKAAFQIGHQGAARTWRVGQEHQFQNTLHRSDSGFAKEECDASGPDLASYAVFRIVKFEP